MTTAYHWSARVRVVDRVETAAGVTHQTDRLSAWLAAMKVLRAGARGCYLEGTLAVCRRKRVAGSNP